MKLGIVLLNMGGPTSLDKVLPFLTNLFNDPHILGIKNRLVQKALAGYIISRRLNTAISHYEKIGGKSPLLEHTLALCDEVEAEFAKLGMEAIVLPGMRYTEPRTEESLAKLVDEGCDRIVAFSMYPQYSVTTSGSSLADFDAAIKAWPHLPVTRVEQYPDERHYIGAVRHRIDESLQSLSKPPLLLFCAHSLPEKLVRQGDPYRDHVFRTVQAVLQYYPEYEHEVVFQSRATRGRWLGPSIEERLPELVDDGKLNLLVIPLSFTCDNVETSYELEIEHRELAEELGVKSYQVVQCPNASHHFAHAIRKMIMRELEHE
ncbi:ferrochelatase [Desulfurispira natronophila]|uniref:Ferrochelatase n=1 Tax=Desulfurispira natronophila TaxID=682562 RepID=A0A7W7Y695_9BACT|nr:ferrochelatase [Desulfurispira natronophila]MBB5022719.1 ferrochelatase [Desulfurispira natronophila]